MIYQVIYEITFNSPHINVKVALLDQIFDPIEPHVRRIRTYLLDYVHQNFYNTVGTDLNRRSELWFLHQKNPD